MSHATLQRRFFAEEIEAIANITTPALVEAIAAVPREEFLGAGPWLVASDVDLGSGLRQTPDADTRRVYHNYSIAIDPARHLFNGAPALVAGWIDKLLLQPGHRVLHVGAGPGYYTALIAHTVGSSGAVVAIEVDQELAGRARASLAKLPWVEVQTGDSTGPFAQTFDAILINAGVTHPQDAWLDALAPGGRMIVPLTAAMPVGTLGTLGTLGTPGTPGTTMGTIGKGIGVHLTKDADGQFTARRLSPVAIYSGIGLRDASLNEQLGRTFMRSPFPPLRRLRRDPHDPDTACWFHTPTFCFAT
jgi:protein-L-isoaspartate(D-aspartate) O-methyltransferase